MSSYIWIITLCFVPLYTQIKIYYYGLHTLLEFKEENKEDS